MPASTLAAFLDVHFQLAELLLVPADKLAERDGEALDRVVVHHHPLGDLEEDLRAGLRLDRRADEVQAEVEYDLLGRAVRAEGVGVVVALPGSCTACESNSSCTAKLYRSILRLAHRAMARASATSGGSGSLARPQTDWIARCTWSFEA
jgi:hypothetical protein